MLISDLIRENKNIDRSVVFDYEKLAGALPNVSFGKKMHYDIVAPLESADRVSMYSTCDSEGQSQVGND